MTTTVMRQPISANLETEENFGGEGTLHRTSRRDTLGKELCVEKPGCQTKTAFRPTAITAEPDSIAPIPTATYTAGRSTKASTNELALFARYRETESIHDLDCIVKNYQGLVRSLAYRFRGRGAELDDLVQAAQVGLLLSIDRFDAECGAPFIGFATATILGELRKYFRTVWCVHMPRSLQESTQLLGPAANELQQELGRFPSLAELADRTGMPCARLREVTAAACAFRSRSLDAPMVTKGGESLSLHESVPSFDAGSAFEAVEAKQAVETLLKKLTSRSRKIVELRYYQERSQREIAEAVGLSQMQVSRLLRQAMQLMSSTPEQEPTDQDGPALAA
jgi:RNA polymerase sigma-B factor